MTTRFPVHYIPHGGGPCFFMDWNPPGIWDNMAAYLRGLAATLPEKPKGIVVVSAHWEEDVFAVGSNARPPLIYDYYGFPPHTYQLRYDAPGAPALAARLHDRLHAQGLPTKLDPVRGLDHGVFIPFKLIYPDADIPVLQLSLKADLDPAAHLAAGRAIAPLRDDGILIVGSGMSYHNLQKFMRGGGGHIPESDAFDTWLTAAVSAPPMQRNALLEHWHDAPYAQNVHPREEHLMPLMTVAGAAGDDRGVRIFSDRVMGAMISGYQFG